MAFWAWASLHCLIASARKEGHGESPLGIFSLPIVNTTASDRDDQLAYIIMPRFVD